MKKKLFLTALFTIVIFFIGLMAGRLYHPEPVRMETPGDHRTTASEKVWTCSMHPQIRQNEPGDCPICGMELIPVPEIEETGSDGQGIAMSSVAMQLADVATIMAGGMRPVKAIRLSGKVYPDERRLYSQSTHIPGRIENLKVNYTGNYVRKGQVIAEVYSPELITAQAELIETWKIKNSQPELFNAAKTRLMNWKMTETQIDTILDSGNPINTFPVRADYSGYVSQKMVNPGDYLKKGAVLYNVMDLSAIWVLFDVHEADIVWIGTGDPVDLTIPAVPGKTYRGSISFIDPVIDPLTRVAKARVELTNTNLELKPEMFASGLVHSTLTGTPDVLVIPKSAVMWTGRRSIVYVKTITDQTTGFRMRTVTLGPDLGDSYIVESGLQKMEEIAVSGTFSIDAAAQLAGKPSMMNPETGPGLSSENPSPMAMDMPNNGHRQAANADAESEVMFRVEGNCVMCRDRIEAAALSVPGVRTAGWNQDTHMLRLSVLSDRMNTMDIHKAIAAAGHDTDRMRAEDDVYSQLPGCCRYRD